MKTLSLASSVLIGVTLVTGAAALDVDPQVPAYTAVDARWGWHINRGLELSLVGQNLFDPRHGEWSTAAARVEFDRALFVKLLWRTP